MPGFDVDAHPDGHNVYTFSQSWLNTFSMCPEQARLNVWSPPTDATAIGQSMHTGIEAVLLGKASNFEEALRAAEAQWAIEVATPGFQWIQVKHEATALGYLQSCLRAWYTDVYPQLPGVHAIEGKFDEHLGWYQGRDEIRVKGAMDLVDNLGHVWDWKTAARPYEQWEVDRFKIQPNVYGYAESRRQGIETVQFHYAVSIKGPHPKPAQILSTSRGQGDFAWLLQQCQSIVGLIQANLDSWPLNDQGWHCSAKWCPNWASCKGDALALAS